MKRLRVSVVGLLAALASLLGCNAENDSPICTIQINMQQHERQEIAAGFDRVANELNLESKSYNSEFSSGAKVTVGFLARAGRPVASLIELDEQGMYQLSFYSEANSDLRDAIISLLEKIFNIQSNDPCFG